MKIHYKTIVLDEKAGMFSEQIIEKNRQYVMDYCCDKMSHALGSAIHIAPGRSQLVLREEDAYDDYMHDYAPPIQYCPFCGELIERVEEYRCRIERHNVRIPKKVTPAYTETRNKEVRL